MTKTNISAKKKTSKATRTTKKVTKKTVSKKSTKKKVGQPSREEPSGEKVSSKTKKAVPARLAKGQVVYETVNVLPFFDKKHNPKALGSLTAAKAKEILGWREESENMKFKGDYLFVDRLGKKIRCINNLHNRPFNPGLAQTWMIEILRKKWRLNGETCIIDSTGMVQDAQHRFVALVWAVQEWHKNPSKWLEFWGTEPVMDTVVVTGISSDDDTVNTINTGKPRTLSDVVFRSEYFRDLEEKRRKTASRATQWTVRLLWLRSGQINLSKAPRMPHSEACEFIELHPRILEPVRFMLDKEGKNNGVSAYLPIGFASGIMYLMGTSKTNRETYEHHRSEGGVDFTHWDEAVNFWNLLIGKDKQFNYVLQALLDIPEDAGGGFVRTLRCAILIKAWQAFIKGKRITKSLLKIPQGRNENDHLCLLETPICGGLDLGTPGGRRKPKPRPEEQEDVQQEEDHADVS